MIDGFDLTGRAALVTGARREIGRAIALTLARAGADLALHHAGPAEEADALSVAGEVLALPRRCEILAADFTAPGRAAQLASEAISRLGRIDILVLNASIEIPEPFGTVTDETFDRQINVDLRASLELLQALVPPMAARGWGRVVTVGSIQQWRPAAEMLVYAGAKAAQANWAVNLARQFGQSGVTVNNLAPGAIATARNREQLARDGGHLLSRIPVGRFGRPDDLAGAALLLCSEAGSYINGIDLRVDGGFAVS